MKQHAGYTLIELMIVVGIMVILGAVGFTNYRSYQFQRRLTSRVDSIVATLRHTQTRAIAQEAGETWGVHFERPISGASFYQVFSGTWAAGMREVRQNVGKPVVYVTPGAGGTVEVIFAKRTGTANAATISLALSQDITGTQKNIIVNAQGNIQQ